MARYVANRLAQAAMLLVIVSAIGFALLHLAPGGPLSQFAASAQMTQEDLDRVTRQLGLDRPLPIQYLDWLGRMLKGDWGKSYRDGEAVLSVISSHLGATLELMTTATIIAVLLGCWIGILGALRRYSLFDSLATVGAMIALSIPTFWFGLVTIYVFSVTLGWLPAGNRETVGDGSFLDLLHHLIAPAIVLALVETAMWGRFMRSSMLEVINQDYIRTARAKGMPEWRMVAATLNVANAILLESYLSYLGYGIQPPAASLGNMLNNAQIYLTSAPWLAIAPGVAITLAVTSFNFLGDGLRDALDPRMNIP